MGRISKGILGGFAGTVGTVIGGKWRGIEYMRSRPTGGRSNPSTLQLAQRIRFALGIGFCVNHERVVLTYLDQPFATNDG